MKGSSGLLRNGCGMPDARGRFLPGEHWRRPQPFWDEAWLRAEYVDKRRSAAEIAEATGCTEGNILHWLRRHGIPRRTMREIRSVKRWGVSGPRNGMYGACGVSNPNWKGGVTAERQAFYASPEWAAAVKAVWKRDGGRCRRCGRKYAGRVPFHIHHRIAFAVKAIRANLANLVLLCQKCHRWVHSRLNVRRLFVGAFQTSLGGAVTAQSGAG